MHIQVYILMQLSWPGNRCIYRDVDLHRPKKARGNEKDKLPSGVEPRSNDQQPAHQTLSHDHQTKVCPLIPSYNRSTPGGSLSFSFPLAFSACVSQHQSKYIYYKCKNIFTKMLRDVGMEVPKSIETRSKYTMHAFKGRGR